MKISFSFEITSEVIVLLAAAIDLAAAIMSFFS